VARLVLVRVRGGRYARPRQMLDKLATSGAGLQRAGVGFGTCLTGWGRELADPCSQSRRPACGVRPLIIAAGAFIFPAYGSRIREPGGWRFVRPRPDAAAAVAVLRSHGGFGPPRWSSRSSADQGRTWLHIETGTRLAASGKAALSMPIRLEGAPVFGQPRTIFQPQLISPFTPSTRKRL